MIEPIVGLILLMLSQSRPSSQSKVYSHYGRSSVGIFSGLGWGGGVVVLGLVIPNTGGGIKKKKKGHDPSTNKNTYQIEQLEDAEEWFERMIG